MPEILPLDKINASIGKAYPYETERVFDDRAYSIGGDARSDCAIMPVAYERGPLAVEMAETRPIGAYPDSALGIDQKGTYGLAPKPGPESLSIFKPIGSIRRFFPRLCQRVWPEGSMRSRNFRVAFSRITASRVELC